MMHRMYGDIGMVYGPVSGFLGFDEMIVQHSHAARTLLLQ